MCFGLLLIWGLGFGILGLGIWDGGFMIGYILIEDLGLGIKQSGEFWIRGLGLGIYRWGIYLLGIWDWGLNNFGD